MELDALRQAARVLASQDGRGVPKRAVIELAGSSAAQMTVYAGDPVVAVVRSEPGGSGARWAALTPRELEVAELVAAGHANRDIAARLVISLGTVKDHVHSILEKTGLPSRTAVAAEWHRS